MLTRRLRNPSRKRRTKRKRLTHEQLESRLCLASLSGFVFVDVDQDSTRDPFEYGIPGVFVELTSAEGQTPAVQLRAMTANDGSYSFLDLDDGDYNLREVQPSAFEDGSESVGSQGGETTTNDVITVTGLSQAEQGQDNNFAEQRSGPARLSRRFFLASTDPAMIFRDANANRAVADGNTQDAEAIRNSSVPSVVSTRDEIVNQPPSFTIASDPPAINEDAGLQTLVDFVTNISPGPANESAQTVTFQTSGNSNTGLFSGAPVVNTSGTLNYTPVANGNGTSVVTLTAVDNGGTSSGGDNTSDPQSFTITVNPVNDAPSFTVPTQHESDVDAGAQSVANFATAISAGPDDESGQQVSFNITGNDNASLFSVAPAISSFGTLTYTAAAGVSGQAVITVQATDDGGTDRGGIDTSGVQTFTIIVNESVSS